MKNFKHSEMECWTTVSQSTPPKVMKSATPDSLELSLWVFDEPFEFGILPMQPSHKISTSLLRKVSAYIKMRNMYPVLNLSAWLHISQLKLQLGSLIPWIYLRMFDILKQQMNRQDKSIGYWDNRCEQFRNGKKDKRDEFRVPTFEFLIFLYIQNSYKIMKKICLQMTNVARKREDRWPIKSSEPKIQSEQLHYQYLYDNIEDLIDFLQEGYKSTDEVSITIIEALNFILCCTNNPRECTMNRLETIVASSKVANIVGYNYETQTVSRQKFVQWVQTLLKLNPWGNASSFVHALKIFPPSGSTKGEEKESANQNRIIFNQKPPPYSWVVISNICHQVFHYDESHELTNLKVHRCNNSYIYVPYLTNCAIIEKCNNSTIFLGVTVKIARFFGCKNIKVYCTSRLVIVTDCVTSVFYILTPSQPVLTGSKNENIQIGPYNTHYPMLDHHLEKANLKPNICKWNEPIQIGSDGMSQVIDSQVVSLVQPSEFSLFTYPFEVVGNTTQNPFSLPEEYLEAINSRTYLFDCWKNEILEESLNPEQTTAYRLAILKFFKAWLATTGNGRELDGLKNLQQRLECRSNDQQFQPVFEFCGDANHNHQSRRISSIHSDFGLPELFEDVTMAEIGTILWYST